MCRRCRAVSSIPWPTIHRKQRPELVGLRSAHDTCASWVELEQGVLRPTDFGTCFRVAVMVPARAPDP